MRFLEWLVVQWRDTKRYFNLGDRRQSRPPALLIIAAVLVIFLIFWAL